MCGSFGVCVLCVDVLVLVFWVAPQLYQNMDDDVAIKLDRERMEFMRREDQQKHQHKLELSRLEQVGPFLRLSSTLAVPLPYFSNSLCTYMRLSKYVHT